MPKSLPLAAWLMLVIVLPTMADDSISTYREKCRQQNDWAACIYSGVLKTRKIYEQRDRYNQALEDYEQGNLQRAQTHLGDMCEAGFHFSCNLLGVIHIDQGNHEQAVIVLEKGCANQDVLACKSLGEFHLDQSKPVPDKVMAAFSRGCSLRDSFQCLLLGEVLRTLQFISESLSAYALACQLGEPRACHNAGVLSYRMKKSFTETAQFYRQACERNYPESCHSLAHIQDTALGDTEEAINLLEKNCHAGFAPSCQALGAIYANKFGNLEKSLEFFGKSCQYGEPLGCRMAEQVITKIREGFQAPLPSPARALTPRVSDPQ